MTKKFDPDNPQHQAAAVGHINEQYGGNIRDAVNEVVRYVNTSASSQVLALGDTNIKHIFENLLVQIGAGIGK